MFLPSRPNTQEIDRFLAAQREANLSYTEVCATRNLNLRQAPSGYTLDHNRVCLGAGHRTFSRAVAALNTWRMFDTGLTEIYPPRAPVQVGQTVVVLAHHLGFYSLNACRIVYLIDETNGVERYGFAYGTLAEHGERGEERFMVEWHRSSDEVFYDLLAFSHPKHVLAVIGYPVSRMLQKRFARQSKSAMLDAVNETKTATQ